MALPETEFTGGSRGEPIFEQCYRTLFPSLVAACRSWGLDGAAEDLANEAFLIAFERWDRLDHSRPMLPFLRTVALNLARNHVKKQGRHILTEPIRIPDQAEDLPDIDTRLALSDALVQLPESQRRALHLHYVEDRSCEEGATQLETSVPAFKQLLYRGRLTLQRVVGGLLGVMVMPFHGLRRAGSALEERTTRLGVRTHADHILSISAQQVVAGVAALVITLGGPATRAEASERPAPEPIAQLAPQEANSATPREPAPTASTALKIRAPAGRPPIHHGGGGSKRFVNEVTDPNRDVTQPEDARMTSIVPSPGFQQDATLFAAGVTDCRRTFCPSVLFRSTDAGESWIRLEARDFFGVSLLLPPTYGRSDNRIFAMGPSGLQVSEDGGKTFQAAAVAGATNTVGSAAISPAFNDGDPTILIGAQTLMRYRDDLRTIEPVQSTSVPGPLEPAYSPTYPDDPRVVIGGLRYDPVLGDIAATVFTCTDGLCSGTALGADNQSPKIRLTSAYAEQGVMHAFTFAGIFTSTDAGMSFERLPTPWSPDVALWDVAVDQAGDRLYAALRGLEAAPHAEAGLYLSSGGTEWQRVGDPLLSGGAEVVVTQGQLVIVALAEGGVACSQDAGISWNRRCP